MAIDFDRLGLSGDQQAAIDAEFLDVAVGMYNGCDRYYDMVWRTWQGIGAELEAIHDRVFDQAHIDIIDGSESHPIKPVIIKSLAN